MNVNVTCDTLAINQPLSRAKGYCLCLLLWLIMGALVPLLGHAEDDTSDAYQVLRQQVDGFAEVIPGRPFVFPDDHGPHPDYRIEWWYITANLQDEQGKDWGIQWTLFRQSMDAKPVLRGWESNQLWMAHAAVSSPLEHQYGERFARGGIGQAGVLSANRRRNHQQPFEVWLDDWVWKSQTASPFPSTLSYNIGDTKVRLNMRSSTPWVLQGNNGFSQKSGKGQASYYYSQPHIQVEGTISHQGQHHQLTGHAWLDREWSSQPLAKEQKGWDWFSLHLESGDAVMVYRLRQTDGKHWLSGSWIDTKGNSVSLASTDILLREKDYRWVIVNQDKPSQAKKVKLPLSWEIEIPRLDKRWQVDSLYDQQWMNTQFPYWEGIVKVQGSDTGMGYMELTGYPVEIIR